jgi:hypothetical protein
MKIYIYNHRNVTDYLKDVFLNHLLWSNSIEIHTNMWNAINFKDYGEDRLKKLYGNGHTVWGKLESWNKDKLNFVGVADIKKTDYDYIVFSEVIGLQLLMEDPNTNSLMDFPPWLTKVFEKYKREQIIVLDGLDRDTVNEKIVDRTTYYKREIGTNCQHLDIHPISFAYPAYAPTPKISDKTYLLAPCDPRFAPNSYVFGNEFYYNMQYSKALFAVTTKKGGWDCMRHYEIIANNCVPYFPGIENKPKLTMKNYPVKLQEEANKLYEDMAIGAEPIKITDQYVKIKQEFTDWMYDYGTSYIYPKLFVDNNSKL